eukprot:Protomagalhaensia_sp_Gyna_25__4781@NODE_480_length_3311_cov_126_330073_g372_i0_p2_GENE_NODE_480_length_3311_cov_126_330073_g372_i0NODE_480_length_3311_cov_126_330073_g372_i0_p2_ORF_typecomplete_len476_score24_02_NODE_480_length_3311_cov_126_330073_g372_i018833256
MKADDLGVQFRRSLLWGGLTSLDVLISRSLKSPEAVRVKWDFSTGEGCYGLANHIISSLSSQRLTEEHLIYAVSLGQLQEESMSKLFGASPMDLCKIGRLSAQEAQLKPDLDKDDSLHLYEVISVQGWRRTNFFRLRVLKLIISTCIPAQSDVCGKKAPFTRITRPFESPFSASRSRASTTDSDSDTPSPSTSLDPTLGTTTTTPVCDNRRLKAQEVAPRDSPLLKRSNVRPLDNLLVKLRNECLTARVNRLCQFGNADQAASSSVLSEPILHDILTLMFPPTATSLSQAGLVMVLPGVWLDYAGVVGSSLEAETFRRVTHIVTSNRSTFLRSNPHVFNYLFIRSLVKASPASISHVLLTAALYVYRALITGGTVVLASGSDIIGLAIAVSLCMCVLSLNVATSTRHLHQRLPPELQVQLAKITSRSSPSLNNMLSALAKLELILIRTPVLIPEFPV